MTNEEYGNQPVSATLESVYHSDTVIETRTRDFGITLRQHYAGLAMKALLSNPEIMQEGGELSTTDIIAQMAIQYTDALISQLNKQ